MTRFRANIPAGVNALPARQYPKRRASSPKGALDELRGRAAAHVNRIDAVVLWNGAIHAAVERLVNEPDLTRERAIDLLTGLQADVF